LPRLAATPAQLQRLLEMLIPFGFSPTRIELTPNGAVVLHGAASVGATEPDLLAEWEAKRAQTVH